MVHFAHISPSDQASAKNLNRFAMSSFESSRSKAYSADLRWRMVYQRCILDLPYAEVARNLNVDPSTVCRTVKLFEETGTVCSIQGYRESPFKKLTAHDELAILGIVLDKPSTHLREVQQHLLQTVLVRALQHCNFALGIDSHVSRA